MRIKSVILCLVIIFSAGLSAAEFDIDKELRKKVSFDFNGLSIQQAAQKVSEATGFDIIPLKSVISNVKKNNRVFLTVKDMPLGQFLDWLAGSVDARYRIFPDGRVYLSQNYEWVEINKFGMLFVDLEDVIAGYQELEQLDGILNEMTKIISLFDDNYYSRIEEQADMVKLVAHIPRDLKPVFSELIELYSVRGKDIKSYNPSVDNNLNSMNNKLNTVKEVNYPYLPLNVIIKRLEYDFGVNIGCTSKVYNNDELVPEISLKIGRVSLKEAIDCILEKTAVQGVEISLPDGLWLTDYEAQWVEDVPRRFLWSDTLVLRSYNIERINMIIPGDIVVDRILNNVARRSWFDPLASLSYCKKNNNLIVLANIEVQDRVLAVLQELTKRLGID